MTETVTSLLPFRTTMPVLLAGCTRIPNARLFRAAVPAGIASMASRGGTGPFLPASASVWGTGYP